jgi:hypothetical protein
MTARLPFELRNGVVDTVHAWFAACDMLPGREVNPQTEQRFAANDSFKAWAHSVIVAAQRTPYFSIVDYMDRWWYMPELLGERARVHRIRRSDHDRHLHDHPWHFASIILDGGYTEVLQSGDETPVPRRIRPGDIAFRHAEHRHRLELEPGADCWTLVLTSPNNREWGFWMAEGFVPWRDYENAESP